MNLQFIVGGHDILHIIIDVVASGSITLELNPTGRYADISTDMVSHVCSGSCILQS